MLISQWGVAYYRRRLPWRCRHDVELTGDALWRRSSRAVRHGTRLSLACTLAGGGSNSRSGNRRGASWQLSDVIVVLW